MGLNIVVGCTEHRARRWIFRGHEGDGIADFYLNHWTCQPGSIVISDDQRSDPWVDDDQWVEETFPTRLPGEVESAT